MILKKKLNVEINGHNVLLKIDFLYYGPHTSNDKRFNMRQKNIILAFNIEMCQYKYN